MIIVDHHANNSIYDQIKHTKHCKRRRKYGVFYQCYLDDSFAQIAFDKNRICRPLPSPCGLLDEHGNPCRVLGTHVLVKVIKKIIFNFFKKSKLPSQSFSRLYSYFIYRYRY